MECVSINTIKVISLEKYDLLKSDIDNSQELLNIFEAISNNMTVDKESIKNVIRLVLREMVWCELEAKDMYVHFGYDYYIYIGITKQCSEAVIKSEKLGLFVEPYSSPH